MEFIGEVFVQCYQFLNTRSIYGYTLFSIIFEIFAVAAVLDVLRMTKRKGDET